MKPRPGSRRHVRTGPLVLSILLAGAACLPVHTDTTTTDASTSTTGTPDLTSGSTSSTGALPTTSSSSTSSSTTSTTTGPADPSTTDLDTSDGGDTFPKFPDAGLDITCSVFVQDCPPGTKCAPHSDDGTFYNTTKCVPLKPDPAQPGEPCTVAGDEYSGIDTCDVGGLCWGLDDQGVGACSPLCKGSTRAPVCDDEALTCALYNGGTLSLCVPQCDPLASACLPGDVCVGNPFGDGFICALDASGDDGQQHDPCEYANSCDPGLLCLDSTAADECDPAASGCCQPYCDLTDPNADMSCGAPGLVCNPYYEDPAMTPPGHEDLGYCAIPA